MFHKLWLRNTAIALLLSAILALGLAQTGAQAASHSQPLTLQTQPQVGNPNAGHPTHPGHPSRPHTKNVASHPVDDSDSNWRDRGHDGRYYDWCRHHRWDRW
jgi:hypothetical protein